MICFDKTDVKIVIWYQKIDSILEAISYFSLLAKNCFRSTFSTNQSVFLPIDESNKEIDVLTNLFIPLPIVKTNEEADVSTNQFVSSSIDKPNKEIDEDIYFFCYFIKYVLWFIFLVIKVGQNHIIKSIIDSLEFNPCFLRSCLNIAAIHLKYIKECKRVTKANIMQY